MTFSFRFALLGLSPDALSSPISMRYNHEGREFDI
jgi:hypothetical protein